LRSVLGSSAFLLLACMLANLLPELDEERRKSAPWAIWGVVKGTVWECASVSLLRRAEVWKCGVSTSEDAVAVNARFVL
jgi:hypothetical protein